MCRQRLDLDYEVNTNLKKQLRHNFPKCMFLLVKEQQNNLTYVERCTYCCILGIQVYTLWVPTVQIKGSTQTSKFTAKHAAIDAARQKYEVRNSRRNGKRKKLAHALKKGSTRMLMCLSTWPAREADRL